MLRLLIILVIASTITACGSMQSDAYQTDRKPQDRDTNNGAEDMRQYSNDQATIRNAELKQQCEEAKIAYLKAKKINDDDAAEKANDAVREYCLSGR